MLRSHLAYVRGIGVDARWVVAGQGEEFFRVTKRLHNHLHGYEGDGGELGEAERKVYEDALEENARELAELIDDDDVVILHDPQTAGLVGPLKRTGARVVWRCHIGLDEPNDLARATWDFLRVDIEQADAYVFSRELFVWEGLARSKVETPCGNRIQYVMYSVSAPARLFVRAARSANWSGAQS